MQRVCLACDFVGCFESCPKCSNEVTLDFMPLGSRLRCPAGHESWEVSDERDPSCSICEADGVPA